MYGSSTNSYGIYGYDAGTGVGVFGQSANGLAGSFTGNVNISGTLTVGSTTYTSDENLKADVRPIDAEELLQRVHSLPFFFVGLHAGHNATAYPSISSREV